MRVLFAGVRNASLAVALCLPAVSVFAQNSTTARDLAATCFTCHGTDGNSVGGVPPSLAGRDRNELVQTMRAFRDGSRPATLMHQQAKGYTDEHLELIAGYFAAVKPRPAALPPKAK